MGVVDMMIPTRRYKVNNYLPSYNGEIGFLASDKQVLVLRLPHSRTMKVIARSMLFAIMMIVSLPLLASYIRNNPSLSLVEKAFLDSNLEFEYDYTMKFEFLPVLFHDLSNEGLYKVGQNGLFLSNGDNSHVLGYNEMSMSMVSIRDTQKQDSVESESCDFIFTSSFDESSREFIERVLKISGIVAVQLASDDSFLKFQNPENYKIVYIRRFESTIIAMKKTSNLDQEDKNAQQQQQQHQRRKLFEIESTSREAKKAALKNLEDVLLEPPRASSGKSSRYLKKTRFLPDLLNDTLEKYPRRLFIDVGLPEKEGGSGTTWFDKNYPTRNLHFEKYKIETSTEPSSSSSSSEVVSSMNIGMSDWLMKNVKETEYVVMKAEAEVVDEMVSSKAIRLVDELFLECKPTKGKRAYWECLALYGRLRDEGVAVHQWWG